MSDEEAQTPDEKTSISYDEFMKLDMGERTVAAGIKAWYDPEELVGKTVTYLANLEPRKLRGVVSQGMLLAAGENAALLSPEKPVAPGAVVR